LRVAGGTASAALFGLGPAYVNQLPQAYVAHDQEM